MTIKQGRLGRRFNRANMADPRGSWAAGAPASGGFRPEQGVRFSGTNDPLSCPPMPTCDSKDESGKTFSATTKPKKRLMSNNKRRGLRRSSRK